jgi:DNA-binding NtrC family response regulator
MAANTAERVNYMASSVPNPQVPERLNASTKLVPEQTSSNFPTILMATTDAEIRSNMDLLLKAYRLNTLWAGGMEEVKAILAKNDVTACFCSFWLVDGTYRDVVRHLKRERPETPVVIVCAPTCPQEYRDYLAALNIRAFDFICHPYRPVDLDRILRSAMALRNRPLEMPIATSDLSDGAFGSAGLRRAS